MSKFINTAMHIDDNYYKTSKGNTYYFRNERYNEPTKVEDKEDIEYFRKDSNFKEITITGKIKEKIITEPKAFDYYKWLKGFLRDDLLPKIISKYPTIESLKKATQEDLEAINGIGRNTAIKVVNNVKEVEI